jgi:predicted RNase H-like HicB family nuclease
MSKNKLMAIIEQDEAGNYVGMIPSLRSCYTQAKTLPELYKRLEEVSKLSLEVEKKFFQKSFKINNFIALHQLTV